MDPKRDFTYTYCQRVVTFAKGNDFQFEWTNLLVGEMANYLGLQEAISETEKLISNPPIEKQAIVNRIERYKNKLAEAEKAVNALRGEYLYIYIKARSKDFEAVDKDLEEVDLKALQKELTELYAGVKVNDLDAVAAIEAGLNAAWQKYNLQSHGVEIGIFWRIVNNPEVLYKKELAAARRAKSTKTRKTYTPLKPAKVGSRLLASIQHCDPGLTAIEKAVLVCLALSDSPKEDITNVKDLKELVAPRKDNPIPLTAQWFESRVIDLFQRGGRWQQGQDPEALKKVLVDTLEGLTKERKITFWDSAGDKYTMRGLFLARTEITNETKQEGATFYSPCVLFSFLKQQKYDIIDPVKFCEGLKEGGEIYAALRCEIGSWQPMLSRGNSINVPIAGILPEYGQKREGKSDKTEEKRRAYTRKKLQREADRITEEEGGGVDISITANNKGKANITITPTKKPGKDDGKEPETEQV